MIFAKKIETPEAIMEEVHKRYERLNVSNGQDYTCGFLDGIEAIVRWRGWFKLEQWL